MKRLFKRMLVSLTMAAVCISLAACGGSGDGKAGTEAKTDSGSQSSSSKDTLIVGLVSEPTTMDALTSAERVTMLPVGALYDRLVFVDAENKIEPGIAESWEISEDGLEYVFQIRQGVKFHKGQTLTVDDVVFTFETLKTTYSSKFDLLKSVEAVDDTHVKMTLEYPFSPFLYNVAKAYSGIVNKETYEANPESYARDPNGTGPFKFESWQSGDNVVLTRFDEYWRGPAALRQITFRIVSDESTELVALQAGEIDTYTSPSMSNRPLIDEDSNLTWYEVPGSQVTTLAFNMGNHPDGTRSIFADNKALREAVCYAVNKDNVVIGTVEGTTDPLYTPYPKYVANYPESFDGNIYNVEKAKEKLAEAGYPDGLTIKIKTTSNAGYAKPAEVIQGELSKIGINLELQTMERGTYLQEVYNNFDYDVTVWAVSCDYPDADAGMYRRFYSGMISAGNNYMQVNDPKLDEAIMTNRTSLNEEEKKEALVTMAEIIRDEVYCLPLYSSPMTLVANSNLEGVNITAGMEIDFYRWSWK